MADDAATIRRLKQEATEFRDARDWKQFHAPKELAISLVLESAELLEHFEWKTPEQIEAMLKDPKKRAEVSSELADCLFSVLLLGNDLDIDLSESFRKKLAEIGKKYPVDKAKGRNDKYTAYQ